MFGRCLADRRQLAKHGSPMPDIRSVASPADRSKGRRLCGSSCLWLAICLNPFKSSKPMANSRSHGNGLTPWLMSWSRAMRARRLRLLPGRRRRTRAEIDRHGSPIACSSLVASHLLIPTSTPMTSPFSRAGGSGNSTHTTMAFSDKAQPWTRRAPGRASHLLSTRVLRVGMVMRSLAARSRAGPPDRSFRVPARWSPRGTARPCR